MDNGFLEVVSPKAYDDLKALNTLLAETIKNVKVVNENMIGAKTPSGSDSAVKALNEAYKQQEKTIQSLQSQLSRLSAQQNAYNNLQKGGTTIATNNRNATREQAVAQQILRAETDRNIRANTLLGGAYAKASAQLLILKKQAKDYAIALGETHPKTLQAVKDANDLGGRIMSADKVVGDFQRNVGNYSNAFTKGFASMFSSVRQLAYILPGIGIAGIFSLALDPLFEAVKGMDMFKTKLDSVKETTKQLSDINKEANKNAISELTGLQGNLKIAQDVTLSYKERMIAVNNLQSSYPFYFENLTKEQILAGETKKAEDALTNAILSRAKANAAIGKITENEGAILDLEQKKIDLSNELTQAKKQEARAILYAKNVTGQRSEYAAIAAQTAIERRAGIQKDIISNQNKINALEKINQNLLKYTLENQKEAIGLDYKKEKSTNDKKRANVEAIDLEKSKMDTLILTLQEQIKLMKEAQLVSETHGEWQFWQDGIDQLDRYIYRIKNGFGKELSESAKKATDEFEKLYGARAKKQVEEMSKATRDWIDSFNTDFLSGAGVGALDMFFRKAENGRTVFQNLYDDAQKAGEGWKVSFLGITQVAEESFAFLDKMNQQYFDNQYSQLEQQRNIAIKFAGESVAAQDEINREYDERRKKIARQEAEEQKRTAIFKAIINTAQAVVSALPNIPLSIAVGLIGAAQIALISSQQIPAFEKGTDNAPEGWAITQEKGAEIITDKNGKVKSLGSNKGAQYTYLNKGDKVFTAKDSEALMFNREFNALMSSNNIGMPIVNVNNDNSAVVDSIERLANRIDSKPTLIINQDERGRRVYERKQAQTKEILNGHLTYRGYDI